MAVKQFTWSKKTPPSGFTGLLRHVAYTSNATLGKYCAVGDYVSPDCAIITSPDGTTWTRRTSGYTGSYFMYVTTNNTIWVVVGGSGTSTNAPVIYTSSNGTTWTSQTISTTSSYLWCVIWDGTNFVTCGAQGRVATSPDGTTWTVRTPPSGITTNDTLYRLAYNGSGRISMGAADGRMFYSDDHGVTWSAALNSPLTTAIIPNLQNLTWNGSYFISSSGYNGDFCFANTDKTNAIATSADGYTWAIDSSIPFQNIYPPKLYCSTSDGAGESLFAGYQGFSYTCTGTPGALTWSERDRNGITDTGFNSSGWSRGACYDGTSYWVVGEASGICQGKYQTVTIATNPYPADAYYSTKGTNIAPAPSVSLTWNGIGIGTHQVYLGTSPTSLVDKGNVGAATSYSATGLEYNQTYWWRIDIKDGGNTYTGDMWHFVTVPQAAQATDEITSFESTYKLDGSSDGISTGWTTKVAIDHANLIHGHRYLTTVSAKWYASQSQALTCMWLGDLNQIYPNYSLMSGYYTIGVYFLHEDVVALNVNAGDSINLKVATGWNTPSLYQTYMTVIDLDSPGMVEGVDWFIAPHVGTKNILPSTYLGSTPSPNDGNGAQITFTPDGYSDYLVLGNVCMYGSNVNSSNDSNTARIRDVTTGEVLMQFGGRCNYSTDRDYAHSHAGTWVLKAPAKTSKTLRVECASGYGSPGNPRWVHWGSNIAIIRLNKFETYASDTFKIGTLKPYAKRNYMPPTGTSDSPPPLLRAMYKPDSKGTALVYSSLVSNPDCTIGGGGVAMRTIYGVPSGTTIYSTEDLGSLGGTIGTNDMYYEYGAELSNWDERRHTSFGSRKLSSLAQTNVPIYMYAAATNQYDFVRRASFAAFSTKYRTVPKVSNMSPPLGRISVPRTTNISFNLKGEKANNNTLNVGLRISDAWGEYYCGTNQSLNGIATNGTLWVAVGSTGTIVTSTDGYNWTPRSSGTTETLFAVAYGNGEWCACGTNGIVVQSTNGTSWSTNTTGGVRLIDITYGAGVFCAVGDGGRVVTCAGIASPWYTSTSNTTTQLRAVEYNGSNLFCAVGDNGIIITSPDAVSAWTVRTSGTAEPMYGLAYGNGRWNASMYFSHQLLTSTNGTSWSYLETDVIDMDAGFRQIAYGNGKWVALGAVAGDPIIASTDGITWKVTKIKSTPTAYGAVASPNGWVLVGPAGSVYTSPYGGYNPTVKAAIANGQFASDCNTGSNIVSDGYDGYTITIGMTPGVLRKNQVIEIIVNAQTITGITMPEYTSWFATADGSLNLVSIEDLTSYSTNNNMFCQIYSRKFIPGHRYLIWYSFTTSAYMDSAYVVYLMYYGESYDGVPYVITRDGTYNSNQKLQHNAMMRVRTMVEGENFYIQVPLYAGSYGISVLDNRFVFLDLDSDPNAFIENRDWFTNLNTTYKTNMDNTFTNNVGASITFTPDGYSDYLVMGQANMTGAYEGSYTQGNMRLYDTVLGELTNCGHDNEYADNPYYVTTTFSYVMTTPTAVSRTVSVQMQGASRWDHYNSSITILRLNIFNNRLVLQNLTQSSGYSSTPTTVLTGSFNPGAYPDALILGYMEAQNSRDAGWRHEFEFPSGTDVYNMPYSAQYIFTTETRRGMFGAKRLQAAPRTSQTLNVQVACPLSNHYLYRRNVAMLGTDLYITPTTAATSPNPSDGYIDAPLDKILSWTAGNGAFGHMVYFGTNPTPGPAEYKGTQAGTTFDPHPGVREYLSLATTYYWRIDEIGDSGTVTGPIWSFTTVLTMPPPSKTSAPDPAHNETGVSVDKVLSWTAGDSIIDTTNDVYFGTNYNNVNNGTGGTFKGNQAEATFDPGPLNTQTLKLNGDTGYYWRVDARNVGGATKGDIWYFATEHIDPPSKATVPSPYNMQTEVIPDVGLSWMPGSNAISHNLYFGIDPDPSGNLIGNQWTLTYDPPGDMAINQYYYWRVDEINAGGATTGDVWRFKTLSALPLPTKATLPRPIHQGHNIRPSTTMAWTTGTAIPYVSPITHNVYFGTDPDPSGNFRTNTSSTTYSFGILNYSERYYWRIDEVNRFGGVTTGDIWYFDTAPIYVIQPQDLTKIYSSVYINGTTSPFVGVYAELRLGSGEVIADGYNTTDALGNFVMTVPYVNESPGTLITLALVTQSGGIDSEEVTILLVQARRPIGLPFTRLTRKQNVDPHTVALWRLGASVRRPLESGGYKWSTNFITSGYLTPPTGWTAEGSQSYAPSFSNGIMTVYDWSSPSAWSRISYTASGAPNYNTGFTHRFVWRTSQGTPVSPLEGSQYISFVEGESGNQERIGTYFSDPNIVPTNVYAYQFVDSETFDKHSWTNIEMRTKRLVSGTGNRAYTELYINDRLAYIATSYDSGSGSSNGRFYLGAYNSGSEYFSTSDYGYTYIYEGDPFISMPGTNLQGTAGRDLVFKLAGQNQQGLSYRPVQSVVGTPVPFNYAVYFDGTYGYLENSDSAFSISGSFSVEGWFKKDLGTTGERVIFGKNSRNASGWALRIGSAGTLQGVTYSGTEQIIDSGLVILDNVWYHAAFVWDGTYVNIYVNGNILSRAAVGYVLNSSQPFRIGSYSDAAAALFKGTIADVRVSNIARGSGEIYNIFNALTDPCEGLIYDPYTIVATNFGECDGSRYIKSSANNARTITTIPLTETTNLLDYFAAPTYIGGSGTVEIRSGPQRLRLTSNYTTGVTHNLNQPSSGRVRLVGDFDISTVAYLINWPTPPVPGAQYLQFILFTSGGTLAYIRYIQSRSGTSPNFTYYGGINAYMNETIADLYGSSGGTVWPQASPITYFSVRIRRVGNMYYFYWGKNSTTPSSYLGKGSGPTEDCYIFLQHAFNNDTASGTYISEWSDFVATDGYMKQDLYPIDGYNNTNNFRHSAIQTKSKDFDGAATYLQYQDNVSWDHHDLTAEMWFMADAYQNAGLISRENISVNSRFSLKLNIDGTLTATVGDAIGGTVSVTAGNYTTNAWHYVVFTFEYNTKILSLFLDGVLVGRATFVGTGTDFSSNLPIDICRNQGTQSGYFNGAVSSIRFSRVVRTPKEIFDIYHGSNVKL